MNARGLTAIVVVLTSAAVAGQVQRDQQAPTRDRPAVMAVGTGVVAGVVVTAPDLQSGDRQQPVRRVSVMLASGQAVVPRTAVTDDEGRFAFTGLPAGNYTLVAQKPAWVASVYGSRAPGDSQGIPIAVAEGQRVDGLRIPITRGAVVAGTVRFANGAPAAGLQIQVLRTRLVDGRRQIAMVAMPAQTDDQGGYRVFGLPAGEYVVQARSQLLQMLGMNATTRQVTESEVRWADQQLVQARALAAAAAGDAPPPPGPTVTYSAMYFPGTAFVSDAAVISLLAGGERSNVDFTLALVPTGTVTGAVLMPDGSPAAGASVALEPAGGGDGDVLGMLMAGGRGATGRDGRFTLAGVTPGQYTLMVRAMPRRPDGPAATDADAAALQAMAMAGALAGMLGGGAANPATLWAADTLGVNGQDVGPLSLQLREGLTVEGTVVFEGGVIPKDVSALRVAVSRPASGDPVAAMMSRMMNAATGAANADGTFVVRGLVPGRYAVTVSGKPMRLNTIIPGMPAATSGWVVKSIRWRGQDLADAGVDVQPEVPVTGVVVTLTDRPSELSGTVIDVAGRPTGAFPIVVYAVERAFWGAGSRRVVQAQPASDGKFTVIGLPAGEYYVSAVTRLEPGDLENRQFLEDLVPAAIRLSLADGEKKTQDLKLAAGG